MAFVAERVAAIVEGAGKAWIEFDRLVVVPDGAVEFAFAAVRVDAIVERRGEALSAVPVRLDQRGASVDLLL
ncbi:MAG TPA: hypothetical protein VFN63_06400, partial [Pseudolabrys sp.]|nr:hypothetical protein [Pseudolabrys sp.]